LKKIVFDTSPLLAFAKIDRIDTLKAIFKQLLITNEVYIEIFSKSSPENIFVKEEIGKFIKVIQVKEPVDKTVNQVLQILDDGERSAVQLSYEFLKAKKKVLLIIDEKLGRRVSEQLGIPIMGSIGLLKYMEKQGVIDNSLTIAKAMRDNGYFFSDALLEHLSKT